jgi:hypothetical protein
MWRRDDSKNTFFSFPKPKTNSKTNKTTTNLETIRYCQKQRCEDETTAKTPPFHSQNRKAHLSIPDLEAALFCFLKQAFFLSSLLSQTPKPQPTPFSQNVPCRWCLDSTALGLEMSLYTRVKEIGELIESCKWILNLESWCSEGFRYRLPSTGREILGRWWILDTIVGDFMYSCSVILCILSLWYISIDLSSVKVSWRKEEVNPKRKSN